MLVFRKLDITRILLTIHSPCLLSDKRSIRSMLNHWSQHKEELCTVDIPWNAVHSILQVRCRFVAGLRLQLRAAEVVLGLAGSTYSDLLLVLVS